MSRAAATLRASGLALLLLAAGCGKTIRLGDGPADSDGGPGATGAGPGADGDSACPNRQVAASAVLWIGDSWVQIPGAQHTRVRDLAREAGAIGPNDDYADLAASGADMAAIAAQYATQETGSTKVKVLIMDGGGWDLIVGNGADATVMSVVATFAQLLATVASDGTVKQVVYFLVPESAATNVPALRPGMQQTCAMSAVPCYFLDLQTLWAGHPEYSNGILASDAGAEIVGDAIWAIMQENCIAQ